MCDSILNGGIFAIMLVHQVLEWFEELCTVILGDNSTSRLDPKIEKSKVKLIWVFLNGLTGSSELIRQFQLIRASVEYNFTKPSFELAPVSRENRGGICGTVVSCFQLFVQGYRG